MTLQLQAEGGLLTCAVCLLRCFAAALCANVCRHARVVALKVFQSRRRTVVTGMTGVVKDWAKYSRNDMLIELQNTYKNANQARLSELLDIYRTICGPAPDGSDRFWWPDVEFTDPKNPRNVVRVAVLPCMHEEFTKLDERLVVRRWALPIGGAWALKFGQSLGATVESVWSDLDGCKAAAPSTDNDGLAAPNAGGSPEPFIGLTRVRRVQNCHWALGTAFTQTMFKAPDGLLQYFYGPGWVEVEVPRNAGMAGNYQALGFA